MLLSTEHLLKTRVNTLIGSILLSVVALGAALLIWQASFGKNPVANAFAAALRQETQY